MAIYLSSIRTAVAGLIPSMQTPQGKTFLRLKLKRTHCPTNVFARTRSSNCLEGNEQKSTFFEEDCHQQREPDVIRYLVRLYDISLEGNGSKSQQNIIQTHFFHK